VNLETGSSDAVANYSSGSGTNTLIFNYFVGPGENSSDLDYRDTNALALNGGTIKNSGEVDADLTLAIPGNPGSLSSNKNLIIDTIEPTTSITLNPPNPSNNTTPTFNFTGNDSNGVAGYECQIDAGAFASCGSPFQPTLGNGTHTFRVRAIDNAGNRDSSPDSYTWFLDAIEPTTNITLNPPNPTNNQSAIFNFSGNDTGGSGVAGFECKLDGGSFNFCNSGTVTYPGLSEGSHTFQVRAVDNAGNRDSSPVSYTWLIDLTDPTTTITPPTPANPTNNQSATFNFSGNDTGGSGVAGFECKLDGGSFNSCNSGTVTYPGLSEGSHTFQVRTVDNAGNRDSSPDSYTWEIDITPPPIPSIPDMTAATDSGRFNDDDITNDQTPDFTGTVGEAGVFIDLYRAGSTLIGTATASTIGGPNYLWTITVTDPLSHGDHLITAKARDAAGNESASSGALPIEIDITAPAAPSQPDLLTSSDTGTSHTDNITIDATPTCTGTAPTEPTDIDVTLYSNIDGSIGTELLINPNTTWTITASRVSEGDHVFTATATDIAGNESADSPGLNVTIYNYSFLSYLTAPSRGTDKFNPTDVTLTDDFELDKHFSLTQVRALYNQADRDGWGIIDIPPDHHFVGYAMGASVRFCLGNSPVNSEGFCASEEDCGGITGETLYCRGAHTVCTGDSAAPYEYCETEEDCGGTPGETRYCLRTGKVCEPGSPLNELTFCHKEEDCGGTPKETAYCQQARQFQKPESERVLQIDNIYGTIYVATLTPDLLLVPSTKDLFSTPPPLAPVYLNHYKCYDIRLRRYWCNNDPNVRCREDAHCAGVGGTCNVHGYTRGITISLNDQFTGGDKFFVVGEPQRICLPVDKNNEGLVDQDNDAVLTCYGPRLADGEPKFTPIRNILINNQFGPLEVDALREFRFCVTSTIEDTITF
jgi:hypothetical protein